jgi:hypothetical protein
MNERRLILIQALKQCMERGNDPSTRDAEIDSKKRDTKRRTDVPPLKFIDAATLYPHSAGFGVVTQAI